MNPPAPNARPYWGKYRGKVIDNIDPLKLGRILVTVPGVGGGLNVRAMPCTPYAGSQVGFFMLPPIGANVWIEFEGGELERPIWSGCFWGEGDSGPPVAAKTPDLKVLQTEKLLLILDDKQGKLTAMVSRGEQDSGQTISLVMDDKGIVLNSKGVTVTITPDRIELKRNASVIEIADRITLQKTPAQIEIDSGIKLSTGTTTAELSASALDLKNGASSVALSPVSVNINNGALEIV